MLSTECSITSGYIVHLQHDRKEWMFLCELRNAKYLFHDLSHQSICVSMTLCALASRSSMCDNNTTIRIFIKLQFIYVFLKICGVWIDRYNAWQWRALAWMVKQHWLWIMMVWWKSAENMFLHLHLFLLQRVFTFFCVLPKTRVVFW